MTARELDAQRLQKEWNESARWKGIKRGYGAEDVVRLRGSMAIEHTLAKRGAEKLWRLLNSEAFVNSLGALTGNQAMQQVKAGLKAIYLSGWQVAGDANLAGEMYPDQSLYPVNSVPAVVRRINNTFARADQIQWMEGKNPSDAGYVDYFALIVADAEAGFGGVLNAFELMKSMIEAGAAGVHFEDQLASVKKCGHMGGKVLVPTREAVAKLVAARLAADVCGVPTLLLARTDAEADLVTSDVDENDVPFLTGERTVEGFFKTKPGLQQAVSRGLAYAPYADLLWCETGKPDLPLLSRLRRRSISASRKDAGLQLFAIVQLENESGRFNDRPLPKRARRDGLQIPVHHVGWVPLAQLLDVPSGARLRTPSDDRVRRTAGGRVRRRRQGIHRGQAPARGWHGLLRCGDDDDRARIIDGGVEGLDRRRPILRPESGQAGRVKGEQLNWQRWLLLCSMFSERCSTFTRSRVVLRNFCGSRRAACPALA